MVMPTRKLGSQGLQVSAIGLGCMSMSQTDKPQQEMIQLLHTAIDSGVTFLDTSYVYGSNANELLIGQDILVGLLRLRRCGKNVTCPELAGKCSIVRELHVYGTAVPVHGRDADKLQHQVGFSVNGVLILAFFWILKAFLEDAASRGIASADFDVVHYGLASTPAMFNSTLTNNEDFLCPVDGAIMIIASHLPYNRNGFKFFTNAGGLGKADIKDILECAANIYNGFTQESLKEAERKASSSISKVDYMSVYASDLVAVVRKIRTSRAFSCK